MRRLTPKYEATASRHAETARRHSSSDTEELFFFFFCRIVLFLANVLPLHRHPLETSCSLREKAAAESRGERLRGPPRSRHPSQRVCLQIAAHLMFLNNLYLLSYQRGGVRLSNMRGAHSEPRGPLSQPRCIPYSILSLLVFD